MSLKGHDFYRDIVWIVVTCIVVFFVAVKGEAYWKEEKMYGFQLQSERDLTEEIVEEFRKLSGICRFEPTDTVSVMISLDSYTKEAVLVGVEFGKEAIRFSSVEKSVLLGNVPELLIGEDVFSSFLDKNGYAPQKSQTDKWKENYRSLELTIIDEKGVERKGRIGGIVEQPENKIYMDKQQMHEVFGNGVHTMGGYMEIYGYQNTKKAKEIFEQAGFLTEEADSQKMLEKGS